MRLALTIIVCSLALSGCAQGGSSNGSSLTSSAGQGILSSLRPKADPAMIQHLREEVQAQQLKQQELAARQQKNGAQTDSSQLGGRVLPGVQHDLLAPPAEEMTSAGPVITPADGSSSTPSFGATTGSGSSPFPAPQSSGNPYQTPVAMYSPPPPPGGFAGGLVPPPPAVTLTTQANMGGAIPADSPYASQYMNTYGIPYPQQQMIQAPPEGMAARPPGSLFSNGGGNGGRVSSGDADSAPEKKHPNFVPITPTGMDARSAYKQKDELKALWNGAARQQALQAVVRENRLGDQLAHVEVALPSEASKGSQGVSQRVSDSLFRNAAVDKRAQPAVRKVEGDVVQTYYRYLHTYNLFVRAQQNVAARKQEVEVAGSPIEQQRATADLSQAQSEVESARDDMHSAQGELAAVSGSEAARFVIGKVSGSAPTTESLAQSDAPSAGSSAKAAGFGGFGSMFGFGHKAPPTKAAPVADDDAAEAAPQKVAKAEPKSKAAKGKKSGRGKKGGSDAGEKTADLAPAPDQAHETVAVAGGDKDSGEAAHAASSAPQSEISFELKNVNVTARKSVLSVAIRNSGANNFNFSPDVISISEGNHKLSEAAVRAEFDQTSVQPNQEIKGTITIFGRPYNERLAVVLSEGGKNIQLRR